MITINTTEAEFKTILKYAIKYRRMEEREIYGYTEDSIVLVDWKKLVPLKMEETHEATVDSPANT